MGAYLGGKLKVLSIALLLLAASMSLSCTKKSEMGNLFAGQTAPLLEGMGDQHFDVSLKDTLAVRYFDQAMILSYGFNHKEAERSFRQVAELEPDHPMAWWGVALVQGPNLNLPMLPEAVPVAWEALQKAQELKANGTQREQDYIDALAKRYAENPPEDRTPLDEAYAEAMGKLAEKYPEDLDIHALYAEAMMDLQPWDFWSKDSKPLKFTPKILETLEYVIENNPHHVLANHLYIHATEASSTPEKALVSARNLGKAVPGAGHLVHMPSHTYIRIGMYHEGSIANQMAIESDNDYVAQCHQQGIYPLGYIPHNHHFLWTTAAMEGRMQLSMEAAKSTSSKVDTELMRQPGLGFLQHYWVIPLYGNVRFGQWDEILKYPEPEGDLSYPLGVWHYARGMAYVAKGENDNAMAELSKLKVIAGDETLKEIILGSSVYELMQIGSKVLEGEIAARNSDFERAITLLGEALTIEDRLRYNEPPDWFFPVRQNLGAILLAADKPVEAEKVYREDLVNFPKNGWSYIGLHQSLLAQNRLEEAQEAKKQFDEAWKHADIELRSSRIL